MGAKQRLLLAKTYRVYFFKEGSCQYLYEGFSRNDEE